MDTHVKDERERERERERAARSLHPQKREHIPTHKPSMHATTTRPASLSQPYKHEGMPTHKPHMYAETLIRLTHTSINISCRRTSSVFAATPGPACSLQPYKPLEASTYAWPQVERIAATLGPARTPHLHKKHAGMPTRACVASHRDAHFQNACMREVRRPYAEDEHVRNNATACAGCYSQQCMRSDASCIQAPSMLLHTS